MVSWQLEADGFTVEQACDGAGALLAITGNRPDLVVLDLSLPGVGGLDVLQRIRRDEAETSGGQGRAPVLPIIVLSGRSGPGGRSPGRAHRQGGRPAGLPGRAPAAGVSCPSTGWAAITARAGTRRARAPGPRGARAPDWA
ncbi:response regulator transcription factor [Pseudonocardia sp. H11422]|uniref:response regulator transcription factor n=1 Tax=Pseudonocardia sp. H11422 TaxID=2835866 RepID=UPI0027E2469A|nr:response regulator [Pseudonocardia sp. H11422]